MLDMNACATRYPILLVHGTSAYDNKPLCGWGRIPAALEACGARVLFGAQDGWGSAEDNAAFLAERIRAVCWAEGCEKVNIIAHSKGGLDARCAASSLGAGEMIASISTIGTPHHGSGMLDRLCKAPPALFAAAEPVVNTLARWYGDRHPDCRSVARLFTTGAMEKFNRENPDCPGVYYQSFGFVMGHAFSDVLLWLANCVIGRVEGENDGLVSLASAAWGDNFQAVRLRGFWGISHLDEIDLRRNRLTHRGGKGYFDICDFYIQLVADLKRRGL